MQPANLSDLNTLDLAFFQAIQSLPYQKPAKSLNEMIAIMHEIYTDLPLEVCKNGWTTAQLIMNQVLLCNRGNNYSFHTLESLKLQPPTVVISRCSFCAVVWCTPMWDTK